MSVTELADGTLLVERRGRALQLTLNRPNRLNALTPALLFAVAEAVSPDRVGDAVAVVLRGAGERGFSAGFDLDLMQAIGSALYEGDPIGTATAALRSCMVPVVGVLHGYTIGAAVELVASCDVRIARADLRLRVPANGTSALYRPAGIDAIARRLGWATASELFTFGRTLDASLALARGVVAAVAEVGGVDAAIDDMLAGLGNASPVHADFLRDWAARGGIDADRLVHWTAVREAAVAARAVDAAAMKARGR